MKKLAEYLFYSNNSLKFVAKNNSHECNEKTINTFATRVRQMILKFDEVKQENTELYAMVDERDAKIKALEEKLAQAQSDYDSLKMAKMMTISDNDMEATQKRIAKLIRDVNKCITLLGEK